MKSINDHDFDKCVNDELFGMKEKIAEFSECLPLSRLIILDQGLKEIIG